MVNHSLTFAEFEKLYIATLKRMLSYSPKEVGCAIYIEKASELSDAYPEWAEIVENAQGVA